MTSADNRGTGLADGGDYSSPRRKIGAFARRFPSLTFYRELLSIVRDAGKIARRGEYTDQDWIRSSRRTLAALEGVGVEVSIEGTAAFRNFDTPVVFAGNHMSVLETFALPSIIQPQRPVTFIVKKELLGYPAFGPVLASRHPIVVSREDPRKDLKTVLQEGVKRLQAGISVIIFPQNTRMPGFDPARFNSLGIKLARAAGVPVIPFALQTNAWGTGRWLKDIGRIDPALPVRFSFGEAITVGGSGREAQARLVEFIVGRMNRWRNSTARRTS